jgi:regulator of protease activity HflC (stomatin/prohibitin superfamily)
MKPPPNVLEAIERSMSRECLRLARAQRSGNARLEIRAEVRLRLLTRWAQEEQRRQS